MSTEIQAVSHFRVKNIRRGNTEVEMLEDEEQYDDVGSQRAESHSEKLPCVKRSSFSVFTVSLVVLYLLILAGIITRYVLVTSEKEQLQTRYNNLNNNHSQLQEDYLINYSQLKKLKEKIEGTCPEGWTRFGPSCYFKSTEKKTWFEGRNYCQDRGADLVIINSKEEQEFVTKLNFNEESWLGLKTEQTSTASEYAWKWVDGTPLTKTFWATEDQDPKELYYAACCDRQGKWTKSEYYDAHFKKWICEK